jgi:hypothetical protein
MASLKLLTFVFQILNVFGVLAGAIWLVILGEWSVLGVGLLSIFFSASIIGWALMPGFLLSMAASPFMGRRLWMLGFPFLLAAALYDDAVVGAWCLGVVVFFITKAGAGASLPALLWAYGVAISPLSYMALRSAGPGNEAGFADALITVAAQIAVVVMAIDVLLNGLEVRALIYLCALTMSLAALVQATVGFLVMRESTAR